jgi:putative ABC transport system permease protein
VATLALGIGGTTAVFSLVNGILLKPLAYHDPDRLVLISEFIPGLRNREAALPACANHFERWRGQASSFENIAALRWAGMTLTSSGGPRTVGGVVASAGFLATLGVSPRLGRDFAAEDDQPGRERVILVTDRFWRSDLAASSAVIGQYNYAVVGRLRPGVSTDKALAELNVIQAAIAAQIGGGAKLEAVVRPFQGTLVGKSKAGLLLALAAVGAVLLIACVNLANLLLACLGVYGLLSYLVTRRTSEIGVHLALGATASAVAVQVLRRGPRRYPAVSRHALRGEGPRHDDFPGCPGRSGRRGPGSVPDSNSPRGTHPAHDRLAI